MDYGSQKLLLSDVARELSAALLVMGSSTDDALGLHYIHSDFEKSFAPRSGQKYMMQLMHSLEVQPMIATTTSLKAALEHFGKRYRRRSLVFVISDCIDEGYETALRVLSRQHEIALIRVRDCNEMNIIAAQTTLAYQDSEHAHVVLADTAMNTQSSSRVQQWRDDQANMCKKLNIPCFDCYNDGNHLESLLSFVRRYF
jgi:uncharacterized protein (DUF58 family)